LGDIICISHLRWDFVWQRPQHLLSSLSEYSRVLFVEEPVTRPGLIEPYLEVLPGHSAPDVTVLRLIQPVTKPCWIGHGDPLTQATYSRLLLDYLWQEDIPAAVLWLYTPLGLDFVEVIPHTLLIYDVLDQLTGVKEATPDLLEKEDALVGQADLVFCRCTSLYHDKIPLNSQTYLFPSGVEAGHFAPAANPANFPVPRELAGLPRPIIGYYGVIDDRMDLLLLAYIAQARPDWSLVIVGPLSRIGQEDLPVAANIHYPGMKSYAELPAYLALFNVALVPFVLNEATRYLSPTKALEYIAAHKPVVATPIPDIQALYNPVVRTAATSSEFVQQIEAALQEQPADRRPGEDKLLDLYTWNKIAGRIHRLIQEKLATQSNRQPGSESLSSDNQD
jgi:UDP-galactopyranose mutase